MPRGSGTPWSDSGWQGRVRIAGELTGTDLEAEWHAADLSLLISQAETFGMVVTESLAHGMPVVVRSGTGAVEALAAGMPCRRGWPQDKAGAHPPGGPALPGAAVGLDADPAPLAAVLRALADATRTLRDAWRPAALAARDRLPGWDATARTRPGASSAARRRRPVDGPSPRLIRCRASWWTMSP